MIIPAGQYARTILDRREVIDPASFQFVPRPDYPIWRWFIAPVEVLGGPNALTLITIILFILMVGESFAVLENQLHHYNAANAGARRQVQREFAELFMPSDAAWRARAHADARQAVTGILRAEGVC